MERQWFEEGVIYHIYALSLANAPFVNDYSVLRNTTKEIENGFLISRAWDLIQYCSAPYSNPKHMGMMLPIIMKLIIVSALMKNLKL
jgi:hypothetical protein